MAGRWVTVVAMSILAGCAGPAEPPSGRGFAGPGVAVSVAALNLQGVGDVVWDVEVVNGRTPTADVVWQRRLSSSGYGDGAGSASYVGPCDADPAVAENTVNVWVVGVYSGAVTTLGAFASGGAGGVVGSALDFENPTALAPLTQAVNCLPNADAAVRFDVALMRPAQQGFFDIAVNFNNIFCSAKFDCCDDTTGDGCAADGSEDVALLFAPGGARGPTMVLGFACTAAVGVDVETVLYLDALELDCTAPTDFGDGFEADVVIDPSRAAGNQCVAGEVGGDACGAVTSPTSADADTWLYQVGVYRGVEQLTSGGVPGQKVYWNVALGVRRKVEAGPGIEDCWLRTRGTAHDGAGSSVVEGGVIAPGAVYPVVTWEVNLGSCGAEALAFGDAGAMLRPAYTTTSEAEPAFGFEYGVNTPAAAAGLGCGLLGVPCPAGFTCSTEAAQGSSYPAFCVKRAAFVLDGLPYDHDEVYVPAGTFWMGCNAALDGYCAPANMVKDEKAQHEVTLPAYAIGRTEVTAAAYYAWCGYGVPTATGFVGCLPQHNEASYVYATYSPPLNSGVAWTKHAHPVNAVNWYQARAYCQGLGPSSDICTEAQWERAARGGCETLTGPCQTSMRTYPWGESAPSCDKVVFRSGSVFCESATITGAAGARPAGASPYGALGMAGNVMEWTSDWHWAYPGAVGFWDDTNVRVRRGSYYEAALAHYLRASRRQSDLAGSNGIYNGIRCCRAMP